LRTHLFDIFDVEQGDLLCLFIRLVAALVRKVFVSVFDLIDAAFERRGATLTLAPSWRGSLCHTSGILQCQCHPSFRYAAQENEASSSSFADGTIPRCKLATRVGRFNYYAVKIGYNCGLYFNWPDYERQVRGYSGAQFKGFQRKEDTKNYLLAWWERVSSLRTSGSVEMLCICAACSTKWCRDFTWVGINGAFNWIGITWGELRVSLLLFYTSWFREPGSEPTMYSSGYLSW
jgi:hypothetical protein